MSHYGNCEIVRLMRDISSKFDVSYWREICRLESYPSEYWDALAKGGLFGLAMDRKWGGMGKTFFDICLATEETAETFSGIGSYVFIAGSTISSIFSEASEEQKKEIFPKLAEGKLKISVALTEEISGLNASAISSKATIVPGGYELTGSKTFVANVADADYLVIFVRTSAPSTSKRSAGISMFLIPADSPGLRLTKLEKLGMDFVKSYNVSFTDLKVSEESLIGKRDAAWSAAIEAFVSGRVVTAASLIGTGKLAINQATRYASDRIVFGKAIGAYQGIQFPLADVMSQLLAAEELMKKTAEMYPLNRKLFSNYANLSLYTAVNSATTATERSLQTFGGHGYYKDFDVERYWRDVRAYKVHPISEELLLASIAEHNLGLPPSY